MEGDWAGWAPVSTSTAQASHTYTVRPSKCASVLCPESCECCLQPQ